MRRVRIWSSAVLIIATAVLLPVGLAGAWANATLYDTQTFSRRSVDILESPAVRREIAVRLTGQLAISGNRQAVNFGPGFQVAIEAIIDTDTFRSIFRSAVAQTHASILAGRDRVGLDLSDSIPIIAASLQLPSTAEPGALTEDEDALQSTLTDTAEDIAHLYVWDLREATETLTLVGLIGAAVAAAAAIARADDRRRAAQWVGVGVIVGGLLTAAIVPITQWYSARHIDDGALAAAVRGALGRGMSDLTSIGLWAAAYGLVIAAAANTMSGRARRLTPRYVADRATAWVSARRESTAGTVLVAVMATAAGAALVVEPLGSLRFVVLGAGLWLGYLGLTEILRLVQSATRVERARASPARRYAILGGAAVVLLTAVSVGFVLTTRRAADAAEAAGVPKCNGSESLCDLPLNRAVFPGTHNSMSAALTPGWLFAEHIQPIGTQLDRGIRALLVDTHYGVASTARMPGSNVPVILTDRASELQSPGAEAADPATAERAESLAARAPREAGAARDIFLCHNYCELGAVRFDSVLADVRGFLETHPDDVVMMIVQDATTPADTAAAFEAAGLSDRAYTLDPEAPLPTLGEMIRSGRNLLVFAELGGPGAPDWYHSAYDWFQETPFRFAGVDAFNCDPNRGPDDAPMFLLNHWITTSPPDPNVAARANAADVLETRARRCADERGQIPNVLAVDFSERGDVVGVAERLNRELLTEFREIRSAGRDEPSSSSTTTTTTVPGTGPQGPPPPPLDPPTVLPSLTGGDPGAFCATVDPALRAFSAWAVSSVVSPPGARGLPDLAYAPIVARTLDATLAAAPVEIVRQATPAQQRVHAAVAELRALGLDDREIAALADLADRQLADDADALEVLEQLVTRLEELAGDDAVDASAASFVAQNPEPRDLFDLGEVPDDVAEAADYSCLVDR
jgi:hypothetical protein